MNIFAVHRNPVIAAHSLGDEHLSMMAAKSCQILSSALINHEIEPSKLPLTKTGAPYKGGYPNHPCTIWAGETQGNYKWLCLHALALTYEYKKRYKKQHANSITLQQFCGLIDYIPFGEQTSFVKVINKDKYPMLHNDDAWTNPVLAYRAYYMTDKKHFAKWGEGRNPPAWWNPNFTLGETK
ncbi:MAG: hypothetical protein HOC79_05690 [Euryarchaeota archaeon]|jgi:hypothetical protein|nr:hypothetical protein [Euryarchaeota archaeon]